QNISRFFDSAGSGTGIAIQRCHSPTEVATMKLKISIPLLCAATGLTIMHAALAADLSRGDERFLRKAAESGMLEIQASELATQKAQHPEVKKYAEMMLKDHSAADKELKALAASKGFQLPVELEGGKKRLIDKLRDREGADFDDEYVDEVAVDAHEDAVDLFEDAADDAKDRSEERRVGTESKCRAA